MPSTSQKQQKFFGAVLGGAAEKPKGMTMDQVRDFARTKRSGLPVHAADGVKPMTNTAFQQSETQESKKRPEWMERATKMKAPGPADSKKGMPYLADGKQPSGFRVRMAKVEAAPIEQARKRPIFGKQPEMMADGKKWASKAFIPSHAGKLHKALDVPTDKKIPAGKLNAATHSSSSHLRHMAQAAKNI